MPDHWFEQPYDLVVTLPFSKDTFHGAYHVVTQMALAHNGIIRGLNSIYLHTTRVPQSDLEAKRDLLIYCQCWCEGMHHHHECEEQMFFPEIEQHRAFTPGFESFQQYVKTCKPEEYDGQHLRKLVEDFAEPLIQHLHDEIATLRALDKYDSKGVCQAYEHLQKALMDTDSNRIAPLVFGTADRAFEGGIHNFPPVPFFVPSIIHNLYGRRCRGAWRNNPCTAWRDPKEPAFAEKA